MIQNNQNSNQKKLLGFRNMQEKLEKGRYSNQKKEIILTKKRKIFQLEKLEYSNQKKENIAIRKRKYFNYVEKRKYCNQKNKNKM